jgi:molybdate transport system substrate-binding protein
MRREEPGMRQRIFRTALLAATLMMPLWPAQSAEPVQQDAIFPPWQHGANNDATRRGLSFLVPQVDGLSDFHGDLSDPKLVLYVGGNYFFAMAPLVEAFEQQHPGFKGHIYWETLPPGLLVKQIEAGGTVTSGNMTWTAKPDAYFAGLKKVQNLIAQGLLTGPAVPYVTNSLTIMVPADNPGHVTGLADLARPDLPLVMPNPEFEGVARQIEASLKKAGGDDLMTTVYKTKVTNGSAVLTQIHHRQTPLFPHAGTRAGRCDLAIRSDLPGADRQPDQPYRYSASTEHDRGLCRGRSARRAARGSRPPLAFVHSFAHGAFDLRALRVQALHGRHLGRLIARPSRRRTDVHSFLCTCGEHRALVR